MIALQKLWKMYVELSVLETVVTKTGNQNNVTTILTRSNPTKWWNTLKQFVGILPTNCLSAFDHFVKLELKELKLYVFL